MLELEVQKDIKLIQNVQKHEEEPKALHNFFSSSEIAFIKEIKVKSYSEKKNCANKLITNGEALGKMAHPKGKNKLELEKLFRKKLKSLMPKPYDIDFTFHTNMFPYGIHTDSGYDPTEYIYKQGIVPLEVFPTDAFPTEAEVYTLILKQKCYHSTSYPRDINGIANLGTDELSIIHNMDFKNSPTDEELNNYWQGISDRPLFKGFEIELPFKWQVGDMAIWDRSHLHCSSDFENHGIHKKVGLMWISKIKLDNHTN